MAFPTRRPAVLALTLFAIAASLPAEVRECLPMAAACEHRSAKESATCSRSEGKSSCASRRPANCPRAQPTRESSRCRLHPTPPIVRQASTLAVAAPAFFSCIEPMVETEAPAECRRGWREPPPVRPRASPASTPRSPRPPPVPV